MYPLMVSAIASCSCVKLRETASAAASSSLVFMAEGEREALRTAVTLFNAAALSACALAAAAACPPLSRADRIEPTDAAP